MFDESKIRQAIEKISLSELELSSEEACAVAFHMTDWLGSLEQLVKFYQNPESFSSEDASDLLMHFLVDAPDHIAAAAKLYADSPVTDVFGVGAVELEDSSSA